MEPSTQSETASQRVFSIPEILGIIFAQNTRHEDEDKTPSHHPDLLRWALVNSRWYGEAIPLLWARPRSSLAVIMAKVKPTRRQYHANYICWALVLHISQFEKDAFAENGVLHGLVFPKLSRIFASIHIPKHHYLRRHFLSGVLHAQRRVAQLEEEIDLDFVLRPISILMPSLSEITLSSESAPRYNGGVAVSLHGNIQSARNNQSTVPASVHWFIRRDSSQAPSEDKKPGDNETWIMRRLNMLARLSVATVSNQQQV